MPTTLEAAKANGYGAHKVCDSVGPPIISYDYFRDRHPLQFLYWKYWQASTVSLPIYQGEIQVVASIDKLPENSFLVGSIYINHNKSREQLLGIMKEEAAKNGADTLILNNSEPTDIGEGWFSWSAEAFSTQEMVDSE